MLYNTILLENVKKFLVWNLFLQKIEKTVCTEKVNNKFSEIQEKIEKKCFEKLWRNFCFDFVSVNILRVRLKPIQPLSIITQIALEILIVCRYYLFRLILVHSVVELKYLNT